MTETLAPIATSIHPGRGMSAYADQALPYKLWQHAGIDCASYPSRFGGLNGYVRLPDDSPQLHEAIAGELNAPPPAFTFFGLERLPGHEFISTQLHAPGGLTYGPDLEGWIGFDTNHAGDNWDRIVRRDMLRRFCIVGEARLDAILDVMEMVAQDHWTESRSIDWTPGRLIAATNALAEQVAVHMYHHGSDQS